MTNPIIDILKIFLLRVENINYNYLFDNFENNININDIIKIFYSDYFMFLSTGFLIKKSFFNFKSNLLKYFDKHNVVYIDYQYKNIVVKMLNIFNLFIESGLDSEKTNFINEILKMNNLNNFFDIKKLKLIYFSENMFEQNLLYKKIKFSNQEIFIPFNSYIIKKMEYKLRTFCQIAEKLGAEKIVINYNSSKINDSKVNLNLDFISYGSALNIENNNQNKENIEIIFEYPNNDSDINLNKFYLINSIINENEFLITKEDFEADLELKFLIDARCINFIQKYNTIIILNSLTRTEKKIFLKAYDCGLNIEKINLTNNYIKINILINFIQIQNNLDIIDGTNIHVLREGFIHLANIIKKDAKYHKLLRYLQSHLNAVHKKLIFLGYDYDNINIINKIYNDIINLNFTENEICDILRKTFENNLTWYNFKKFRDIILKGSDDKIEKIYFISFQYHDILNNIKHLMYDIEKYIDISFNDYIDSFLKINISISSENINIIDISNNDEDYQIIYNFILNNKTIIKDILYVSFKKSFKFKDGLSDNLTDLRKLVTVILNIINYYFDNQIKNLQLNLCNILINNSKYSIKNNLLCKLIDQISIKIINLITLSDISPHIDELENSTIKLTLVKRIQKTLIRFISKSFNFENNINKIIKKLELENDNIECEIFNTFLEGKVTLNKIYKNYNKNELFYTWEDYQNICSYFA